MNVASGPIAGSAATELLTVMQSVGPLMVAFAVGSAVALALVLALVGGELAIGPAIRNPMRSIPVGGEQNNPERDRSDSWWSGVTDSAGNPADGQRG